MKKAPMVIIVGAGLSGLTCAAKLHEAGVPLLVVEASDRIGGRVATDRFEQYLLDRGFQALLTGYPDAKAVLDFDALGLHPFYPGVQIWWRGKFHQFVMPFAHPLEALQSINSPIGSLTDKLLIVNFRQRLINLTPEKLADRPEVTTRQLLKSEGFSDLFIDRFWRPLTTAFLLESKLETSSRVFEFIMGSYFRGEATVPVAGMASIAGQLAGRIPKEAIRLQTPVVGIQEGIVSLPQGETLATQAIVIATESDAASRLLNDFSAPTEFRKITTLYYETKTPPFEKSYFILNGEDTGLVKNVCVPSLASRSYAAEKQHLLAVTLLGDNEEEDEHDLEHQVREHMREWFADQVGSWRYLRLYRIKKALPVQLPGSLDKKQSTLNVSPGIYRCGDYTDIASINGAIASGKRAAQQVLQDLKTRVS